jgi:hypothetical protein
MELKTQPPAVPDDPYPLVSGVAPLTVKFNLCRSSDPDQEPDDLPTAGEGDSLNWQFHFGDDGSAAFDPDGSFNPHFEHFCRVEHTYATAGRYVATVTVTDKHLEDQASGVVAHARVVQRITVNAGGVAPDLIPTPTPTPRSFGCSIWNGHVRTGMNAGIGYGFTPALAFTAGETLSMSFTLNTATSARVSIRSPIGTIRSGPVDFTGGNAVLNWIIPTTGTYSVWAANEFASDGTVNVAVSCAPAPGAMSSRPPASAQSAGAAVEVAVPLPPR